MRRERIRRLGYGLLSTHVQRVILRLGSPGAIDTRKASPAECGAECAWDLECSARGSGEAAALHALGTSLRALEDAKGENAREVSRRGVVVAATNLHDTCPEFVNPPLNSIWANALPLAHR
jgi:hypothetical protein